MREQQGETHRLSDGFDPVGPFGNPDGSPQAVVWSDDHGRTWSSPVNVTAPQATTQNSQPMIAHNGAIALKAFLDRRL